MEVEKNINDIKEITDVIKKIKKIEQLRRTPNRQGMIDALKDAKASASVEIWSLELAQGGRFMLFEEFTDEELYYKLKQYEDGLRLHCVAKCGEKVFDELMKG